ncbi:cyd operon YbgE family protein, partial [Photobacterium sp. R1]
MIFVVGFVPFRWYWKVLFIPNISLPLLAVIIRLRLS